MALDKDTVIVFTDTGVIKAQKQIDSLEKKVNSLTDSIPKKLNEISSQMSILTGQAILSSTEVDSLKKHPEKLYENTLLSKKNWHGINTLNFIFSLIILVLFLYYGFNLTKCSSLCRDESYFGEYLVKLDEKGNPFIEQNGVYQLIDKKYTPPYSYARVQLFWWTIIILGSYIIFFGLTGELLPLNATTVILLGLGVVVLAGGKLIDKQQISDKKIPLGGRTQDKNYSNDFFINILSDEKGVSLHRFQAVVFNVVFGVGFLGSFCKEVAARQYPFIEFNEWQFALLGISASAYLGLKAAENKKPEDVNTTNSSVESKPIEAPLSGSLLQEDKSNSEQHDR